MNEFEWRRQLRELHQPIAPQRDLWAAIEDRLDHAEAAGAPVSAGSAHAPSVRRWRWPAVAGLAASLLLAAGIGWHREVPDTNRATAATNPDVRAVTSENWKPADPRLTGAAIELDAARMELQLAIRQAPDSAALQRLLNRTQLQQAQLRQLANQAG